MSITGLEVSHITLAQRGALRATHRTSGEVESLNGRIRPYLDLRRYLGDNHPTILRFFLNHHRQSRSRRPGGSKKSPAERLHDKTLPHWLEMLGYTLFKRDN